jgi:hypothetical protein
MTNNFTQIKSLLDFQSNDDFYHLQIIKRKKEHPDLGSNNIVIKTYYIQSIDYLELKKDEIISLCDLHDARAYINLNVRSFEKMAFQLLKKTTDLIMNKDFKSARKAYESVCGASGTTRDKKWIIDIDEPEVSPLMLAHIDYKCMPISDSIQNGKIYATIPTKNGHHIITKPFDVRNFSSQYPDIEIHKNNPTILYIK